jgi:hypothetical protein
MSKKCPVNDSFIMAVSEAIDALRSHDIQASRSQIANAMILDMNAPEPQNLYGILCELSGDDNMARKHYRAAYALDPTYKPACHNLERLVAFEWGPQSREYDYGDAIFCESKKSNENRHNSKPRDQYF